MTSLRFESRSTTHNLSGIIDLLNDVKTERVIFFASETLPTGNFSQSDGPETNLPLVAALLEIRIPGVTPLNIVFDGLFLTAARQPRYFEVRSLLDAAINSGKAFFSQQRVPFTSSLGPEEASDVFLKSGPVVPLSTSSRSAYFSLLSSLSEESFA